MIRPALLLLAVPLAGCAVAAEQGAPAIAPVAGLKGVMGENAAALVRTFGQPDADVREGSARKLQFAGPICVLDAYLYPKGTGEPRVTWVDTRQRDGAPIDRASCVAALQHRAATR